MKGGEAVPKEWSEAEPGIARPRRCETPEGERPNGEDKKMKNITSFKAENIRDVIRYLQKFQNATVAIYLDDETISSPLFSSHIRDIAFLHDAGIRVIIIPGAKRRIDEILTNANISWEYHNHVRITAPEAMPLIKMAAFDVSNTIMTSLAANNITAVIGNWVRARGKGIIDGVDYCTAGEIEKLEAGAIRNILDNGFIPIFPCIGWTAVGHPYNISSIRLAQQVAISLGVDKLFYVIKDGGIDKSKYIIPEGFSLSETGNIPAMNVEEVDEFISVNKKEPTELKNKISDLLKITEEACREGVTRAHIVDGKLEGVLLCEIFSDLGAGTMIYISNYEKLRPMEQNDIPAVLSIMAPFIKNGKLLPRTEKQLAETFGEYIVYEMDGGVHGCAALHKYNDGQVEICAVAVDETFSHVGIGPKLVTKLIEKATRENAKSIFIMTTQAADWFEQMGFSIDKIETLPPERRAIWNEKRNSKVYRYTK